MKYEQMNMSQKVPLFHEASTVVYMIYKFLFEPDIVCPGIYLLVSKEEYKRTGKRVRHIPCGEVYTQREVRELPWSGWSELSSASGGAWSKKRCPKDGGLL